MAASPGDADVKLNAIAQAKMNPAFCMPDSKADCDGSRILRLVEAAGMEAQRNGLIGYKIADANP
jgi:hypothetical protein